MMNRCFALLGFLATLMTAAGATNPPFTIRGYYTTFMRMPTFGLPEWKQMIDCMKQDGANFLVLWTAGAFRSKAFPVTWQYNRDHKNVAHDYARELIDYAHTRGIQVVLGFTPFAYDGVNQYPLEHPELKATQKNGQPANLWGLHAWGYNLCPAKEASQRFMRDYVREMFRDFYPNADGLLIEASDYAICHCADCSGKYFDREFAFVRQISDDVWRSKPDAMIFVYPRYFSSRQVPEFGVSGARQKFDPRWSLSFTPHSAPIDDDLSKHARSSVYWNDGLTIGTPSKIRDGARLAAQRGLSGYITSCEPFSCIDGPPGSNKPRQKPFHMEWLRDGEMPLNELPVRVNRVAYREWTRQPALDDRGFEEILGRDLFGPAADAQKVQDVLYVQDCWFNQADWFKSSPLHRPADLQRQAEREKWPAERWQPYLDKVKRLQEIERRYANSKGPAERQLHDVSAWIVRQWDEAKVTER
ncbi:MAG: hypothetical protein QOF48_3552 [Verrucomicrobiota bacterium]